MPIHGQTGYRLLNVLRPSPGHMLFSLLVSTSIHSLVELYE